MQLGEGACGYPPFSDVQRRILSIVLRSPARLAVCARCTSGVPELQDLAEKMVQIASLGRSLYHVVTSHSFLLGASEAVDMLRLLLHFGLLMQDQQIEGATGLRIDLFRALLAVTAVGDKEVCL